MSTEHTIGGAENPGWKVRKPAYLLRQTYRGADIFVRAARERGQECPRHTSLLLLDSESLAHQALQAWLIEDVEGEFFAGEHG